MATSRPESSLFEDAIQGAWSEIVAWFPGNGDASWSRVMLELAVAALRRDKTPTIVVQHPQYLADFHHASISGPRSFDTSSRLVWHSAPHHRPGNSGAHRRC
jgi:hypothetical protein